jgi:hypothetical protein
MTGVGQITYLFQRDVSVGRYQKAEKESNIMKQSSDKGLIVFIGTGKRGRGKRVLVTWVPVGGELELRDCVQQTTDEQALVLGVASATKSDVEKFRATHAKSRRHGFWYERTSTVMHALVDAMRRERSSWRAVALQHAA